VKILKRTNRFYCTRPEGYPQIRIYHKKGPEKKMPRYLLKCGCCDEKLEIYYDNEGLEINGVKVGAWFCIHISDSFLNYKGGKEHLERHNKRKLRDALFQDLAPWSQKQHLSDILF